MAGCLPQVGGGVIEVLSTGGDPQLGGDDFDNAIVSWLVKDHLQPAGVDCSDPHIRANLRAVAEAAKVGLSTEEQVVVRMPLAGGIKAVLTRQLFEGLAADLFRRARQPLDQACWQVGGGCWSGTAVGLEGVVVGLAVHGWSDGSLAELLRLTALLCVLAEGPRQLSGPSPFRGEPAESQGSLTTWPESTGTPLPCAGRGGPWHGHAGV